jgi:hypothetical protein
MFAFTHNLGRACRATSAPKLSSEPARCLNTTSEVSTTPTGALGGSSHFGEFLRARDEAPSGMSERSLQSSRGKHLRM